MTQQSWKAGTQLIARCSYNPQTGKARFENYSHYYSKQSQTDKQQKKQL